MPTTTPILTLMLTLTPTLMRTLPHHRHRHYIFSIKTSLMIRVSQFTVLEQHPRLGGTNHLELVYGKLDSSKRDGKVFGKTFNNVSKQSQQNKREEHKTCTRQAPCMTELIKTSNFRFVPTVCIHISRRWTQDSL